MLAYLDKKSDPLSMGIAFFKPHCKPTSKPFVFIERFAVRFY